MKQSYDSAIVFGEIALQILKEKSGETDTLYANMLTSLMVLYYQGGNLPKAIDYSRREREIRKILHGIINPKYATSCAWLGFLYKAVKEYNAAEQLLIEAKNIRREVLGEMHPNYIVTLKELADLYDLIGNYTAAESFYLKADSIDKVILGSKNPAYATDLNNLAYFYSKTGNYKAAEPLYLEAIKIDKEVLGEKHPGFATDLSNLGSLYSAMSKYNSAESLYKEALNIRKEVFGEEHTEYAMSINNLGNLYWKTGNYSAAEDLFIKAINIDKNVLGIKSSEYAIDVNNLAVLYCDMGNYIAAEPLLIEILKTVEELVGKQHPDYSRTLNNLAMLYFDLGNYPAAEPLFIEAKNIREKNPGKKHPLYASSLNNLASLYDKTGRYSDAELLYIEAMDIQKEILGADHPDYSGSLNNLAGFYVTTGKYDKAEPLFIEAKNIDGKVFGIRNQHYASDLNNLAFLYCETGDYTAAELLYLEAISIVKETLGENHPEYTSDITNLAELYSSTEKYDAAEPYYLDALEKINRANSRNFAFLSEKEKEMFFKRSSGFSSNFYSYSLKRKRDNPSITTTVYNNVIKNKGLLLKSSTAMRTAISGSQDTTLILKYEEWISLRKEISALNSTEIKKRKISPDELEQQANIIEKNLVQGSLIFSDFDNLQKLNFENVKNSLNNGETAIEFISFPEGKKKNTVTFCALLVNNKSIQPEMIRLFEERELNKIMTSSGGNNFNLITNLYGSNQNTSEALYKLIWKPLEPYLKNVKTIYYSPDGILHKVSFAALGVSKDTYLCDIFNLQQVSSTVRVVIPENSRIGKTLTACIIGGIDYSSDSVTKSIWKYLPGTLTEATSIKNRLTKKNNTIDFITGRDATEVAFKNIFCDEGTHPEILHIATHGFFYPDPEQLSKEEKKNEKNETGFVEFRSGNTGYGLWQFVNNKNPLMRSGIILSGADRVSAEPYSSSGNEGVLTAQEVIQSDMSKTKLAVLSACETGLGDIKGSEGVYGLQRAFKMAGVKFIIMSLWQVPDKETSEFMLLFYEKLLMTKDIRKSFNKTQSEMRKKYDPYFWAAFVLIE